MNLDLIIGIDIDQVTQQLEEEGVTKFTTSWEQLLAKVDDNLALPRRRRPGRQVSVKVAAGQNPLRDPRDRRLPRIAGPCGLVIFGVTGDLARKKLMPAVYDLTNRGLLPPGFALTGFARRDWATQDFAQIVHDSVKQHARTPFREAAWRQLSEGIRFVQGTSTTTTRSTGSRDTVEELDPSRGTGGNHAFYLSIPPSSSRSSASSSRAPACRRAGRAPGAASSSRSPSATTWPVARELKDIVSSVFRPDDDLPDRPLPRQGDGAEPVGAALRQPAVRTDLELQLRRPRPDHDGRGHRHRWARGLLRRHRRGPGRHPEPPHAAPGAHRDGGARLVRRATACARRRSRSCPRSGSPREIGKHTSRGQYAAGWQGGEKVVGYLEEEGFNPDSTTETFAAIRVDIDTRRWAGVPFYLRTGKRLGRRVTEIAVVFKRAPHLPFESTVGAGDGGKELIGSMLRDPDRHLAPRRPARRRPVQAAPPDPQRAGARHRPRAGRRGHAPPAPTPSSSRSPALTPTTIQRGSAPRRRDAEVTVKVLPSTTQLLTDHVGIRDIRDINLTDVLGRHQIDTDVDAIAGYLTGKRVLVTGAGGSIGSELCRQIHRFAPGRADHARPRRVRAARRPALDPRPGAARLRRRRPLRHPRRRGRHRRSS